MSKIKEASGKRVTPERINLVKTLKGAGMKNTEVARIAKMSDATVGYIVKSGYNLSDYTRIIREVSTCKEKQEKKTPRKESFSENKNSGSYSEILAELKGINNNLERLAKAWESTPRKSGLFG